jgi:hypothetical protein
MPDPDFGKESRENYKLKHPDEAAAVDTAYETGEDQPDPVGLTKDQVAALRKKIAEKASRYSRPAGGYADGPHSGPVQGKVKPEKVDLDPENETLDGGGVYVKPEASKSLTDKQRCNNIYHWVEDMFWPKGAEPGGSDRAKLDKNWGKLDEIEKGDLDIGKRTDAKRKEAWYCIEQAEFMGFLLRQLGYKVQYKNIIPSLKQKSGAPAGSEFDTGQQTAALNVWFNGKWNFFDPFESFSDSDGGMDAYLKKKGNLSVTPYHDIYAYALVSESYARVRWGSPEGPLTGENLDGLIGPGWKRVFHMREAGVSFENLERDLKMALRFDSSYCGWVDGEMLSSIRSAVYRDFDRPEGAPMGDSSAHPAKNNLITYNFYQEGNYPFQLLVTNVARHERLFQIEMLTSQTNYLEARPWRRILKGSLGPGKSCELAVPVKVTRIGDAPPKPVTDVQAVIRRNREVMLFWTPVAGAVRYQIYRRVGHALATPEDLRKASRIGEAAVPCFHFDESEEAVIFYAILAIGSRGRSSGLDHEEGSSIVRDLRRKSGRKRSK